MKQKRIPFWLSILPDGRYSLSVMAFHADKSKNSVVRTLRVLGVKKEHQSIPNSNMCETIYIWEKEKPN
jgi:hypothetical protein